MCLAEDWRWVDQRTIEFKLRQGVTFHNGEKFNAESVRVNWEQYRKMEKPRPHWFKGFVIPDETAFEIIDEYKVRFTFPEPDGLVFVKFLWFPQIAPAFFSEHRFHEKAYGYFEEPGPWGTGPFKLVEGSVPRFVNFPSDYVVLEAYGGYWDPRYPKVKRLIFDNTLLKDREEAMRLCRETEGKVDVVSHIRPLDTLKMAESPYAKVMKSQDVVLLHGVFNQRKRGSKWKDIRLRKSINYAINREELLKYCAKGNAYNLAGSIPPGVYGHNQNLHLFTYDTSEARALLEEAGYPNGFEMTIITTEAWKLEAQIISRMLERVGLKVTVEVLSTPEFWRKWYIPLLDSPPEEQGWDMMVTHMIDWTGNTGASFFVFDLLEGSGARWIKYDPVFEEMFDVMAGTIDKERQEEEIRNMVEYVYEKAYRPFIYSPLSLYAVNKEVNFVPQKWTTLRLKETSVTENHWSLRAKNN
jgi:peptide/nickel transport system substrate-binding protein